MLRSLSLFTFILPPFFLEIAAANRATLADEALPRDETLPAGRLAASRPQLREAPPLKKGSIVELFADGSSFATPAIVTGRAGTSYSLTDVFAKERLPRVDAEIVRPYEAYDGRTRTTCNVSYSDDVRETPCTVLSHMKRKSGAVLYEVSYLDRDDKPVQEILPFSMVRRIHGRSQVSIRGGKRAQVP